VRRDVLFDLADAVAREDGAAAFALAGDAVESGYDLRLVVRELGRLARDILVVNIDPSRLTDPELAAEAERDRLKGLASTFSAEDLMRAFEVLTKAEYDILDAAGGLGKGLPSPASRTPGASASAGQVTSPPARHAVASSAPAAPASAPAEPSRNVAAPRPPSAMAATVQAVEARQETARSAAPAGGDRIPDAPRVSAGELKDAFLDEVRKSKKYFHGTVVAQAQRIDIDGDRIVFTFAPHQGALRVQLEQAHAWLDPLASRLSGRRMTVVSAEGTAAAAKPGTPAPAAPEKDRQSDLRQQALADSKVQTMLDVFGAEIKDVEEM